MQFIVMLGSVSDKPAVTLRVIRCVCACVCEILSRTQIKSIRNVIITNIYTCYNNMYTIKYQYTQGDILNLHKFYNDTILIFREKSVTCTIQSKPKLRCNKYIK